MILKKYIFNIHYLNIQLHKIEIGNQHIIFDNVIMYIPFDTPDFPVLFFPVLKIFMDFLIFRFNLKYKIDIIKLSTENITPKTKNEKNHPSLLSLRT